MALYCHDHPVLGQWHSDYCYHHPVLGQWHFTVTITLYGDSGTVITVTITQYWDSCTLLTRGQWHCDCSHKRSADDTSQQDFSTWKVYCVSNVTFHAEFKYAINIFPSPTVFVQWHFLLLIFRNFRYFCQWYYYTWTNILNSFQQRVVTYNLPLSNH